MWVVSEILHAMSDSNEVRFYWYINLSTDMHGNIISIVAIWNSDLHDTTNPVINHRMGLTRPNMSHEPGGLK